MKITYLVAQRSPCLRAHHGAVLVRDRQIIATGYNGPPSNLKHCGDLPGGCIRDHLKIPHGQKHELCRAVHAEQNAIIQCALHGVSTKGATLYCTGTSCSICAKMLINAQIKDIFYGENYPDELAINLLKEAGIPMIELKVKETL